MGEPFRHRLRVRFNECDPQGVVFNANYLTYFDITITELWREAMGGWEEVVAAGADMVVAEARVRYRAPLRFDDEVDLAVSIAKLGESSIVAELSAERDGTTMAEGEIRYVVIDPNGAGKASIPERVRRALEPYAVPDHA